MAHGLGLRTVAEGIETETGLAFLRRHGCDLGQGHLFSRPVDAATLIQVRSRPISVPH